MKPYRQSFDKSKDWGWGKKTTECERSDKAVHYTMKSFNSKHLFYFALPPPKR